MSLPFKLDNGIATKAALGVVVLEKDETLEPELRSVFTDRGVALYHSRIPSDDEVSTDTLNAMVVELPRALRLLPTTRPLDVVAYACTSASTVIGQERVATFIKQAHPSAAATNPITAVIAACRHLNLKRIALLTPYTRQVSMAMQTLLENAGIKVTAFSSFEQSKDPIVARIAPSSVKDAILQLAKHRGVDGIFASCTNLQTYSILDEAEAESGRPVVSSNAALAWHMRALAGLGPAHSAPGSLLKSVPAKI